jgi:hypothetical protein
MTSASMSFVQAYRSLSRFINANDGNYTGPTVTATTALRLRETGGDQTHHVLLKAPASLAADLEFTLPSADGTNNQVLKTNGAGVWSFADDLGTENEDMQGYNITNAGTLAAKKLKSSALESSYGTAIVEPSISSWVGRTAAEANQWYSVCYSNSLNLLCAVSADGTNRVMTSPDGITWTARAAAEANSWYSVCFAESLNLFCAVAIDGTNRVMTSPDGTTWTARAAAEANQWMSVCYSEALSLFCAVSNTGTNRVMTSPDGTTWTARTPVAGTNSWVSVCFSESLSLFCAVSLGGTHYVMTSPDGINWTARTAAENNGWKSVCFSESLGIFCSVSGGGGSNRIMTSANGIDWSGRAPPESNTWSSVCYSESLGSFCAVAEGGTYRAMTSPDGITWTARTAAEANVWRSVCAAELLLQFCAVSTDGTNRVMTAQYSNDIATTSVRLKETGGGTDTITHKAPASVTSSYDLTWPSAVPATNNAPLLCSTAGLMSFGGEWTEYTPTLGVVTGTPPAPTNVTANTGRYMIVGKRCILIYRLNKTSGGTAGSGIYTVSLPDGVTVSSNYDITGYVPIGEFTIHIPGFSATSGKCLLRDSLNDKYTLIRYDFGAVWDNSYYPLSGVVQLSAWLMFEIA